MGGYSPLHRRVVCRPAVCFEFGILLCAQRQGSRRLGRPLAT